MEWQTWQNVPFKERICLPSQPGLYVVVDAQNQVWYVGKSTDLNARWSGKGHHRYKQLSRTNTKRIYSIYWKCFPVDQLSKFESHYIEQFKPQLNYSKVRKTVREPVKPNAELSRLLKVLNQKTMLFPTVRSVVLGFYQEVDEDEERTLEEYTCIVIAISVNDHDRTILNSFEKSLTAKGIYLKDCWKTYEYNFGDGNLNQKLILMPVFVMDNIVYQFVCAPNLIEQFEKDQSNLFSYQMLGQNVMALKNSSVLLSVLSNRKNHFHQGEDYLDCRASDLRCIQELKSIKGSSFN